MDITTLIQFILQVISFVYQLSFPFTDVDRGKILNTIFFQPSLQIVNLIT